MANWHTLQGNFIQGEVSPRFFADVNGEGMSAAVAESLNGLTLLQGNITKRMGSNFLLDSGVPEGQSIRVWPFIDFTNSDALTIWKEGAVDVYTNIEQSLPVSSEASSKAIANYSQELINTQFTHGLTGWSQSGNYIKDSSEYSVGWGVGGLVDMRLTLSGARNTSPDPIRIEQVFDVPSTNNIIISVNVRQPPFNPVAGSEVILRAKIGTTRGGDDVITHDFQIQNVFKTYAESIIIPGNVVGTLYLTLEMVVLNLPVGIAFGTEIYACYISEAMVYAQVGSSLAPNVVVTPYGRRHLDALHFIQSPFDNKELIILHPEFAPHMLYYDGVDYVCVPYDFAVPGDGWGPNNWPSIATAYQGRLVLTGATNDPETVWASKSGNWKDFTIEAAPTPEDGLQFTPTERGVNTWLTGFKRLLFGNRGNEYSVDTISGLLQPGDIAVGKQSTYGAARNPQKITLGYSVVLPTGGNSALRMVKYSDERGGFIGPDVFLKADHLGRKIIRRYIHTQDPNDMLWCIMLDGSISLMSFDEQIGIYAWSHFITDGRYIDACVVTDSTGVEVIIFVVERVISGKTRKYIETVGDLRDVQNWQYLDSHIRIFMQNDDTLVGGLQHLEAKEVHVFLDDEYMGTRVVVDGQIEIEAPANFVDVGLTYNCRITTLPEGSRIPEMGLTAKKRYSKIGIRGLFSNPPIINGQRPPDRSPQSIMDVPEPVGVLIDTDVVTVGWSETGVNTIEEPLPLRLTVAGIYGKLSSSEV